MVVFAHPDDAEFGTGGTIARWAREGVAVEYVCVTDGSAGSNEVGVRREELARTRRTEQLEACEVLGVRHCTFLDLVDGGLTVTLELRRAITREVRRFRPDVLVAPNPQRLWDHQRTYVNHPDHRVVGEACLAVVNPDAPTRPQFPELLDEGFEPFEIPNLWLPAYDEEQPDTFVDIGETIETKIEALLRHRTQVRDIPVEDWVRRRAKERGAPRGIGYAETFITFRLKEDQ